MTNALVKRALRVGSYVVVPALLVSAWWYFSASSQSIFFPPLADIMARFVEMWFQERFFSDVLPSIGRMLIGFCLAIVVGVALGVVLGRSWVLRGLANPLVQFGRAIPATTLIPVAMTLLGIGDAMKVMLIAFVCVFPVLLNTMGGVASVEQGLQDVSSVFGLNRVQRLFAVILPSSMPQIFSGIRISLAVALIMMIVSEMLAATNGIGYLTIQAQQSFRILDMWAGMILLGVLGVLFTFLLLAIERRVLRWTLRSSEA